MYEIYDNHADAYDALVSCEDYAGNLRSALRDRFHWRGARVAEAGIGTGRVTRWYIDLAAQVLGFDRSMHMLEQAARNLQPFQGKLHLLPADHLHLPAPDHVADIFVEGWAFGHLVLDRAESVEGAAAESVRVTAEELVTEAVRVSRPDGTIIFIETLGTNVDEPGAPHPLLGEFYSELEFRHGFSRSVIRTDYLFESAEVASRLCGFFFGSEMGEAVRDRLQAGGGAVLGTGVVVPEFTGIWTRRSGDADLVRRD